MGEKDLSPARRSSEGIKREKADPRQENANQIKNQKSGARGEPLQVVSKLLLTVPPTSPGIA